jgi:hypothetical protein
MSTAGLAPSSTTWGGFVNSTNLPFYRRKWKISTKQNVYTRVSLIRRKQAVDALEAAVPPGEPSIEEARFLR